MSLTNFPEWVEYIIFALAIPLIVNEIYSKFLTKRIVWLYRKIVFYVFNEPVWIEISHFQKYKDEPEKWLSHEIFKEIQRITSTDRILINSINDNCIKLKSEKLEHKILIWLNEEFYSAAIEKEDPEILGYVCIVALDDKIRLARRDFDELNSFITIARNAQEVIQTKCFSRDASSYQRFTLCDIKRKFKIFIKKKEEIEDKKLSAEISIMENKLKIKLDDFSRLLEVIKKYYVR